MAKLFNIKVNGNPYLVEVEEIVPAAPGRQTYTPQEVEAVSFQPRVVQGAVTAPMNGVVSKILCSPGDQVKVGQAIMILEAMKMENEVAADKAGIVQEIRVTAGQSVAPGDILAVIT